MNARQFLVYKYNDGEYKIYSAKNARVDDDGNLSGRFFTCTKWTEWSCNKSIFALSKNHSNVILVVLS